MSAGTTSLRYFSCKRFCAMYPKPHSARRSLDILTALATDADLAVVFVDAIADASASFALRADQHHVGEVNRRLELDDAWLDLLAASLDGAMVFLDDIDPLDDHAVLLGNDAQHFAASPFIFAGDHFDRVALLDPLHFRFTPISAGLALERF